METNDLDFLNISEKTKNKLVRKELDTIEKISTYHLENSEIKEINNVQDEIFRKHLSELGAITRMEIESLYKRKSVDVSFKITHSVSDPEIFFSENTNTCLSSSEETDFSFCNDSVDESLDSFSHDSIEDSVVVSAERDSNYDFNLSNKRRREKSVLFETNERSLQNEEKKNNGIRNNKKNNENDYLLMYSNLTKDAVTHRKMYRLGNNSLNDLLSEGIESAKIYYFYGSTLKINRILLLNMLLDIIGTNYARMKSTKGEVIYIYFCYINDVKTIHEVILKKMKKWRKIKKNKNKGCLLNDLLSQIYILRIQEESELFSFLSNIKNTYLKGKKKTENIEKQENELENILAIGILNFSELILHLNLSNSYSCFYLIRELKVLSHLMCIPILIFDEFRNESTSQVIKGKKEFENENENEEVRLRNQFPMNEMRKNMLNTMSQYDEEQFISKQHWEHGEMDEFVEQEKDLIWSSVNDYIRKDEYSSNDGNEHMEIASDSKIINDNVNASVVASISSGSSSGSSSDENESVTANDSVSNIDGNIDIGSVDTSENEKNNDFRECSSSSSIQTSGERAQLFDTKHINTKRVQQYGHVETMENFFANIEKKSVKQNFIPQGVCIMFDVIVEVDVIKEQKKMKWNKKQEKNKIIRFTLLKSHDLNHFYCHSLLKNNILCDL